MIQHEPPHTGVAQSSHPARATSGFTLIELMIVIALIAIIAGMAVHNANSAAEESRATVCEKNRCLIEDEEMFFLTQEGRPTLALEELVEKNYISRVTCPRGGILTWEVIDPALPVAHQSLVCSIHGPKSRIQHWERPQKAAGPSPLGAGFEDGTFGDWLTLGAAQIVGSEFGTPFAGDYFAYLDTNTSWNSVMSLASIAKFLGVSKKELDAIEKRKLTGGTAIKLEADASTKDDLRINFVTSEYTPTYWYNDTAFMTITNAETGKSEIYKLADTYSDFSSSGTKFNEETGWVSLSDLGLGDVQIEAGDTIGFGVLNAGDKVVSSGILIDEGK